jgi:hypothetical protein
MGKSPGLAPQQQRTLARLKPLLDEHGLYLAGGGAVAHHIGHRQSLDIDLFSLEPDIDLARFRDEAIGSLEDAKTLGLTDATLRLEVSGSPIDVVKYLYAPLDPPQPGPEGVLVAGERDLATMKLAAVSQRGIRRDFWDLYELLNHGISLGEALDSYATRFGVAHSDLYHVLRALTYFDDAEQDQVMPRGLTSGRWHKIRAFFEHAAPSELTARLSR